MIRSRTFLEISAVIIAFAVLFACDSGTKEPAQKPKEKQATKQLSFVDASKGLPTSEMWRQGLAISDINGDGYIDIVAPPPRKASKNYDKLVAWLGNGKGEWSETPLNLPSNIVYNYGSIAVADFNGDKIPDIALAMHSVGLAALKGLGDKKYADFSDGMPPGKTLLSRALVSADFNNDGLPDIAALTEGPGNKKGSGSDGVWVCFRTGERWKCNPISKENEARGLFGDQLVTGDVNGDGNIDIAVGPLSGPVTMIVWLGDGKGGFIPFNKGLPEMHIYPAVVLSDIDKDGRDDLVASVSGFGKSGFLGLKVFLSRPDGFEEISEGLPVGVYFTALNVSDLDQDGNPEIIGGTGGGLRVFSYKDNRWRELDVPGLPEEGMRKIYNIYCTDMNGDGLNDLAVNYASEEGKPSGGIRVFFNNAAD